MAEVISMIFEVTAFMYHSHPGWFFGNPANWPFDHWIHQSPTNVGFLDQIQALKWISQYIDTFRGDPTKVTINGESAGGSAVELHLIANEGGKPLFSGAIAQSVYRFPLVPPEQTVGNFDFYANFSRCGSGSLAEQMACLRNASVSTLARAQDAVMYNYTGSYRGSRPVLDGTVFTDYPRRLFRSGQFKKVPVIVGAVSNETLANGASIPEALKSYFPELTDAEIDDLVALYPASDFVSTD
ncbi:alpha/beta-hydrolase [Gloeophyllum trabeum ATCC 11539]|uniref:Carboxylic ester hydrolase n=1 Tax=Gloeophyllum trabeum (strain ATCC 11539 / FP-39264 / Madison 617) TaxID=670483 RepID=S7PWB2_GLOTA|nr:alpha/beta-hydrolase [Gloeophyllum trabeum ATCC 11539]EPQ51911.1 alpha/beta-hydrolase [Gloeophyllum trabeum ATCC 11539]